ncbi:MAG: hypothetical protein JW709_03695 [Sedimentisphaerales bacterium]|nr:hypothetical protein [Sedimentisphaerales bacterium]
MRFSTDVDVLKREPEMFGDLTLSSQQLVTGSDGVLTGSMFTSASAAFTDSGVAAGHVLRLDAGCCEIVSVDGPTQLTVSVVRANEDAPVIPPPGGNGLAYSISTFDPQAEFVADLIMRYFHIAANETVLNADDLRGASVYGVLAAVFTAKALPDDAAEVYLQKAALYRRLFEQARAAARVLVDTDGGGEANEKRQGGSVRLQRV